MINVVWFQQKYWCIYVYTRCVRHDNESICMHHETPRCVQIRRGFMRSDKLATGRDLLEFGNQGRMFVVSAAGLF